MTQKKIRTAADVTNRAVERIESILAQLMDATTLGGVAKAIDKLDDVITELDVMVGKAHMQSITDKTSLAKIDV